MSELRSDVAENFSLTRGGPFYKLQVRFDGGEEDRTRVVRRALFATAFTWLPLLVLSGIQGLAYGKQIQIPFLHDFAVNIRFLVALPILILAESGIDRQWRVLVLHFLKSGLVHEPELPAFEGVIQGITRLRDSIFPEAIMIAISYLSFFFVSHTELLMGSVSNWHTLSGANQQLSLAGWWFNIVCAPLFRFLMLRWAWRIFLWTVFLWRVSRLNLHLVATHTDSAAGLGFLTAGQKRFSPIVFAGGAVVASQVGNAITYEGATLHGMQFALIAYGVLATLLLTAPLLVTTPVLRKVKRIALLDYGALVTSHNQAFAAKWTDGRPPRGDELLGNPDASSLADMGSSFEVVEQMKTVPISKSTFIGLAAAAAMPMIPLIILTTPVDELVRMVVKMLA